MEAGLYERLRLLLNSMSILPLPRHEATFKLLTNLFDEEEAEIAVSCFDKVNQPIQIDDLSNKLTIPRNDLTLKLDDMVDKGLIRKASADTYMAVSFYPGIIMNYFVLARTPLETRKKISEAALELSHVSWDQEMFDRKYGLWRVMPAVKPTEKIIAINESIEVENKVLPYEILTEVRAFLCFQALKWAIFR